MAVRQSWRSPGRRWLFDQVVDEPGVVYRVWDEGVLAVECPAQADLDAYLRGVRIDAAELVPSATD
jgi:hypothetical protein